MLIRQKGERFVHDNRFRVITAVPRRRPYIVCNEACWRHSARSVAAGYRRPTGRCFHTLHRRTSVHRLSRCAPAGTTEGGLLHVIRVEVNQTVPAAGRDVRATKQMLPHNSMFVKRWHKTAGRTCLEDRIDQQIMERAISRSWYRVFWTLTLIWDRRETKNDFPAHFLNVACCTWPQNIAV